MYIFRTAFFVVLALSLSTVSMWAQTPPTDNTGQLAASEQPAGAASSESSSSGSPLTPKAAEGEMKTPAGEENTEEKEAADQPAEDAPDAKEDENLFDIAVKGGVMMIPLLMLGLLGLTLIIERGIFHYKNKSWEPEQIRNDLEKIAGAGDIRFSEDLEKRLTEARDLYMDKLERGMGLIQGIGNIAPLLGFLGTVIGMINAFSAIAAARTVNAKVVASGIQVALVTTAGGLLVAVPILAAFYFFNHINQNHYVDINRWIAELAKKFPSVLNEGGSPVAEGSPASNSMNEHIFSKEPPVEPNGQAEGQSGSEGSRS